MGKITRTGSLTLAAAVAATLAVAPSALADVEQPGATGVNRIAGPDRVDTAVRASQVQSEWDDADTVILARTDDFADALASSPLADELGAPILLTGTGSLDSRTATEIERLGASTVII